MPEWLNDLAEARSLFGAAPPPPRPDDLGALTDGESVTVCSLDDRLPTATVWAAQQEVCPECDDDIETVVQVLDLTPTQVMALRAAGTVAWDAGSQHRMYCPRCGYVQKYVEARR